MDFLFPFSQTKINILDIIIVLVVVFYAYEGFVLGFALAMLDLVGFVLSFIAALKFYSLLAKLIIAATSISHGFANAASFFLIALATEILLTFIFQHLFRLIPSMSKRKTLYLLYIRANHFLGLIPGAVSAFIIITFLLNIIVSLPSSVALKNIVINSEIGSKLIGNSTIFEARLNDIFGGALNETLNFMTVEPQSNDMVQLHFQVDGTVDEKAEREMFDLVNQARQQNGEEPLVFENSLRDVAREHSKDMLARGYFSHYTPEGLSPFDRMAKAGIQFQYAGENLALAPSTDLAMQGLMSSPGHRANILNTHFHRIGIGVYDGGVYGKMYSQEFSD